MEKGFTVSTSGTALPLADEGERRRTLIRAAAVLLRSVEQEDGGLAVELQGIVRRLDEIAAQPADGRLSPRQR